MMHVTRWSRKGQETRGRFPTPTPIGQSPWLLAVPLAAPGLAATVGLPAGLVWGAHVLAWTSCARLWVLWTRRGDSAGTLARKAALAAATAAAATQLLWHATHTAQRLAQLVAHYGPAARGAVWLLTSGAGAPAVVAAAACWYGAAALLLQPFLGHRTP